MSGNKLLIDTNIALYLLSGNNTLAELLNDNTIYISFITQLELLGFRNISEEEKLRIKVFLNECIVLDLSEEIKENTITLKQKYTIKLPDAIIAATSIVFDLNFISADKNFSKIEELSLVLFE
ncbi:MAG: hypothetical protein RLZZ175_3218 [Bacteroidota bacterium]|jgi:predicted nucleic acid-binding protein